MKAEPKLSVTTTRRLATIMTDYLMGKKGTTSRTQLIDRMGQVLGNKAQAKRIIDQTLRRKTR